MFNVLNFQFSLIELICFAVLMLSFGYQLYFYIRYIRVVLRSKKIKRKTTKTYAKGKLPVSVIITARNFTPENEFVLAYSAYSPKRSLINKLITFDNLFNALWYLGYAKAGKPYMGVGRNIAYKKEVFFKQNGFASNLHLVEGDAELMVNYAANKQNTDIEVSVESVTWSQPTKSLKAWYFQKEQALSITTFYRTKSKFLLFAEPLFRLLFYASFITLSILSLLMGNWPLSLLAGLIFTGRLFMQIRIINKTSSYFKGQKYYLSLLLFDIILPVIALVIMTFGRIGSKSKHISWK